MLASVDNIECNKMKPDLSSRSKPGAVVSVLAGVALLCAYYLWQERYYLRFVPVPHQAMSVLYQKGGFLPPVTPLIPKGSIDFPRHDLSTDSGIRDALNYIQLQSPFSLARPKPFDYSSITFQSWIEQMKVTPFYCTDASMFFMLMAWQQGLMTREWQLLTPGWMPGQGHSLVEFYNPRADRWIVVDPQHAGILRDKSGQYLDMKTLLGHYVESKGERVVVDYGPYAKAMKEGARGPTTEDYLFKNKGLSVSVLNLRPPTWFATAERNDVIIGYPVIASEFVHDARVYITKLVAAILVLTLVAFAFLALKFLRKGRKQPPLLRPGTG
jgi:hypothetical protein